MQNKSLALKVGTQLQNGRYTISRILGQGGFGITYEATLANLKKRVAVKEYFPHGIVSRNHSESPSLVPAGGKEEKEYFENLAALKKEQGLFDDVFYHYDTPLTVEHETDVLRRAGFRDVRIMKQWGESTYTVLAHRD